MKIIKICGMAAMLIVFAGSNLQAQTWSKDQKAVWDYVQSYSDAYQSGDYEKFISVIHEDYQGWAYRAIVPSDKETAAKYIKMGMEMRDVPFYNQTPLSIQVFDDFAIVHYIFHGFSKNKESGETEEFRGRWTDILMKDDGKWYLIADHGGAKGD